MIGMTRLVTAGLVIAGLVAMAPARAQTAGAGDAVPDSCGEKQGRDIPTDIFGFGGGSDVLSPGARSAGLEYGLGLGARSGVLQSHGLKAQVSLGLAPCFEVGPSLAPGFAVGRNRLDQTSSHLAGTTGAVEFKYKLLMRRDAGFGLTLTSEPGVTATRWRAADRIAGSASHADGPVLGNTAKLLVDREWIADTLYGAAGLEQTVTFTRDGLSGCVAGGYCRASGLVARAGLAYKFSYNLFVGLDASHQRVYQGAFLNRDLGHAWFAGPNLFLQTRTFALNLAWSTQLAGRTRGQPHDQRLNVTDFSRHLVKAKIAMDF